MSRSFDVTPYLINDFREWYERGELILSPKFQRRRVWSEKAKSYLIDTILRGLPIPPIFIRQTIDLNTHKTIREVVDGQQRLSTILDFLKNGFKVSKIHNKDFGNSYFNELPTDTQRDFLKYVIVVNSVSDLPDAKVLEIFARLNTYTVKLNNQELWNAEYFGLFKQIVHQLAYDFHTFWIETGIISEQKFVRMGDVDLTSELVIASINGIQGKEVIEDYYKLYDDKFNEQDKIKENFKKCIDIIGEIYSEMLPFSYFNRLPLFYTLYCVIYDLMFGLKNSHKIDRSIKKDDYVKIRDALQNLESVLEEDNKNENIKQFIEDYSRHTTNFQVRERRHKFLLNYILEHLKKK